MFTAYGDLVCYRQTPIESHGKLQFFLEKHSTKEGTWGNLYVEEGEVDFISLDGRGQELSRTRLNKTNPQLLIPPATWHKIIPLTHDFKALLGFYCKPSRFFYKKYGLGAVHSDLHYIYQNYLQGQQLTVLDVGCGSGRNLLYFALGGHSITGIDINESSLKLISEIATKESLAQIQTLTHDLNQPLNLKKEQYDFIFSTVSLQFLKAQCVPLLLNQLQLATKKQGYHFLVFPIKSDLYSLPASFTFLPAKEELYHWYQNSGWAIIEYKESAGLLHKLDESGRPVQGLFGHLLAQKIV